MTPEGGPRPAGVVLAAGESRRFGALKQLVPFRGRPLLEHALGAISNAPSLGSRFVVVGARHEEVLSGVERDAVEVVICEPWAEGQAAALRAGVAAAEGAGASAAVVVLGDQPLIAAEAIERVVAAHIADPGRDAVRATYGGAPGHPVLISAVLFGRVAALRGDVGARELLGDPGLDVADVRCEGLGDPADIDTPAALRALEIELGQNPG